MRYEDECNPADEDENDRVCFSNAGAASPGPTFLPGISGLNGEILKAAPPSLLGRESSD